MKKEFFLSIISILIYAILVYIYIYLMLPIILNSIANNSLDLKNFFENEYSLYKTLAILSTIFIIAMTIIQYLISRFLILMFFDDEFKNVIYMYLVFLPKSLTVILSIIFFFVFGKYNYNLYIIPQIIGITVMMLFVNHKIKNWKAVIVFSVIYILDIIYSFIQNTKIFHM